MSAEQQRREREEARGLVFVLSGPSGVGKDAVTELLKKSGFPISFCVTATTRRPRPGEVHGKNYFFLSKEEFLAMRDRGELLEWAVVHGNYYGIPRSQVKEGLKKGQDLLITVDVQGAATLRRTIPGAIFIFLAPPSLEELVRRLEKRGTETEEERATRLAAARREMEQIELYDYVVVNYPNRQDEAVEKIKAIITAERSRVRPRYVTLPDP